MITSLFSRTRKDDNFNKPVTREYSTVAGIVETIEISRNDSEINGVLLDFEGREFEFKISPNGDLLSLSGVKEDLPLAWNICVDHLHKIYGKNEIQELQKIVRSLINRLGNSIEDLRQEVAELSDDIADIEIPEIPSVAIPQEPIKEIENIIPQEEFEEEEKDFPNLQDFSDEDLASHALKVLSGEVSLQS